ncbi:hypothetical protein [Flavobacterium sp. N502540]|uniref:hypothetical protein n=1 Tax=Flavobacterium sp. N502540 TaxID=2986838 RepID=UPI002224CD6D|nr:hypothetical protein [Flavobacterium sp. N502540]
MRKIILSIMWLVPVVVMCQTGGQKHQTKTHKELSNVSSRLDLICKSKEIMIPRTTLKSRFDKSTMVDRNTKFILVFNTAKNQEILPGYYYWYENKWNNLKNLTEDDGLPKDNGKAGDLFFDYSTKDVYFYNGSMWLSMTTSDDTFYEAVFENKSGVLKYKNSVGEKVVINLPQLVPNFNYPKTISVNAGKETLNFTDNSGRLTILKLDILLAKSKNTNVTSTF